MKNILAILLISLTAFGAFSCTPEEKQEPQQPKELEATVSPASLSLGYEIPVSTTYTCKNAEGTVSVSVNGLPSTISYTVKGTDNGEITFTSLLDEKKEIKASVSFKDRRMTVTKDITLNTEKKPESMKVTVPETEVGLVAGTPASLTFNVSGTDENVTVSLKNPVEGITLDGNYDKSKKNGVITFSTDIKEASIKEAVLSFSDGKTTQDVNVTVKINTWSVVPDEPVIEYESNLLYPEGTKYATVLTFTVSCEAAVDEIEIVPGTGATVEKEIAQDNKSGKISVYGTKELDTSVDITVKAKNISGTSSKTITLQEAYLCLNEEPIQLDYKSATASVSVDTNLEFEISVDESCKAYVKATKGTNKVDFEVTENPLWETRKGYIRVYDTKNLIKRTISFEQRQTIGTTESDVQALIAIGNALRIPEWTENGAWGHYYRNWCTDVNPFYWCGVDWTKHTEELGRVYGLGLMGSQPNCPGVIPEDIGYLTELTELTIVTGTIHAPLPKSLANLTKLRTLVLRENPLNCTLDDIVGLKELLQKENKLNSVSFLKCELYGTIPEWIADINCRDNAGFGLDFNHLSGQVPNKVAECKWWTYMSIGYYEDLEACPRFDKSKYPDMTEDNWYYLIPNGERIMLLQKDNYALWVGERPENTKWVEDSHGGHWEWTD